MSGAVSSLAATTGPAALSATATASRPMSMRLTLAVWTAASIGGWALVLLALAPLL